MPGIKDLSVNLKSLEDQIVNCMKCGMCQSVCPLFDQTRREADVARGKLVLLESLMKEMFDNPAGVEARLNKCLLCGSCAANCPSGVNVLEIFIKARSIITEYQNLPFIKKMIFRKMLANPAAFDSIVKMGSKLQKFLLSHRRPDTGTTSLKLISPLLKDRQIIPFADTFFQDSCQALIEDSHTTGPKVLLFTGCLIDKIFPNVGIAAVKTLLHHNARVIIPKGQGCCGIPALASGDTKTFETLLNRHADLFKNEKFDYLVTACATCTSTIKKLWPTIGKDIQGLNPERLKQISDKTYDISQFLAKIPGINTQDTIPDEDKKTVTYHDPCHLAKSLGVREEPRQLINAASGYTLKEMTDPDRCCGMGGSFNLYHYDLSSQIGSIKRQNIEDTGCDTIATSCPACMLQISDMLARGKGGIEIKHPVELYAEGI